MRAQQQLRSRSQKVQPLWKIHETSGATRTQRHVVAAVLVLVYVVTGILQPTLVDWIKYNGAAGMVSPPALLTLLSNTVGMALGGPAASAVYRMFGRQSLPDESKHDEASTFGCHHILCRRVVVSACLDIVSSALIMVGLLSVGSGVFVVIYSSVTAWTALLSRCVLGTRLRWQQWCGVALCSVGLMANAYASATHDVDVAAPRSGDAAARGMLYLTQTRRSLLVGGACVLVGSVLHSALFVLLEAGSTRSWLLGPPLSPMALGWRMGCVESVVVLAWVASMFLLYSPEDVLLASLHEHHTSAWTVTKLYLLLTATNTAHAMSFFAIIKRFGAVGSSVLKGVQAAAVFFISTALFCRYQVSQCASAARTVSMLCVVAGALGYSYATAAHDRRKQTPSFTGVSTHAAVVVSGVV